MFGTETLSQFRAAAEAVTTAAENIDQRTTYLIQRAHRGVDALPELELISEEVQGAISEAKTAAQLVSIAALCIVGVSLLALGVATIALLQAGDR